MPKRFVPIMFLLLLVAFAAEPQREVRNNELISSDLPKLRLQVDPSLKFVGRVPFNIRNIAVGERFVWAQADKDMHVRKLFVVQFEGFTPQIKETYRYQMRTPIQLGGNEYSHNVWFWDSAAEHATGQHPDANSSDDLLSSKGYKVDGELAMSRFSRIVGDDKRNEIIFFYDESLKDLGHKLSEFPEDGPKSDVQLKLEKELSDRSLKMFRVID